MKILVIFIPDHIVDALGWTIFHSLWQGMIIGLILMLIYKFRPNISSQARYILGVIALAAILTSSLLTFNMAYHPVPSPSEFVTNSALGISNLEDLSEEGTDERSHLNHWQSGWKQSMARTFDLVSMIWFFGVLMLSLRLLGGMLVIDGMRRKQISPLPAVWEQKLRLLVAKTGIKHTIRFLQSQKVKVPTVIGILRPVVLIPAMVISGLPADQLEVIIVHELAHIRRYDFLINILQSIMEALFFYHPAVWIISENIRQEREKCCDDDTVRICGQVSLYARALAGLCELQITSAFPSVAITGNNKKMVDRVERLINHKKMKTNANERIMAGLALVISVMIITLSTGATFKPASFAQMESQAAQAHMDLITVDTLPGPEPVAEPLSVSPANPPARSLESPPAVPVELALPSPAAQPAPASPLAPMALPDTSKRCDHVNMDIKDNTVTRNFRQKDGKDHEMKFIIRKGAVEELYVDGKKIPKNEFSKYQKEIDVTLKDLRDMERDLRHARVELENVDFEKISEDIRIGMERFNEEDMRALHEEMMKAHEEIKSSMEEHQDGIYMLSEEAFRKAMEQMEQNLAEARENMAMIDEEQIRKMMDEAVSSIREIDHEKIQREIEEAMERMKEIDLTKIQWEVQTALKNMEKDKINLEAEKQKIDKTIEELEKLELYEK